MAERRRGHTPSFAPVFGAAAFGHRALGSKKRSAGSVSFAPSRNRAAPQDGSRIEAGCTARQDQPTLVLHAA